MYIKHGPADPRAYASSECDGFSRLSAVAECRGCVDASRLTRAILLLISHLMRTALLAITKFHPFLNVEISFYQKGDENQGQTASEKKEIKTCFVCSVLYSLSFSLGVCNSSSCA